MFCFISLDPSFTSGLLPLKVRSKLRHLNRFWSLNRFSLRPESYNLRYSWFLFHISYLPWCSHQFQVLLPLGDAMPHSRVLHCLHYVSDAAALCAVGLSQLVFCRKGCCLLAGTARLPPPLHLTCTVNRSLNPLNIFIWKVGGQLVCVYVNEFCKKTGEEVYIPVILQRKQLELPKGGTSSLCQKLKAVKDIGCVFMHWWCEHQIYEVLPVCHHKLVCKVLTFGALDWR